METPFKLSQDTPFLKKSFGFNFFKISENFVGINFREQPENYNFAGINFGERPKNSRNRESFYPRNFLPLKYSIFSKNNYQTIYQATFSGLFMQVKKNENSMKSYTSSKSPNETASRQGILEQKFQMSLKLFTNSHVKFIKLHKICKL